MAGKIISFRFPEELLPKVVEKCQQGESVNDFARRILLDAVGGEMPLPPVPATDVRKLIAEALAEHQEVVNSRLQDVSSETKATVEALIEVKLAQIPSIPPVLATNIQELITEAIAEQSSSVNNRLQQLSDEIKVTVKGELAQYREDVDRRLQASNTEIGVTVEALVEEKLSQHRSDVDSRLQASSIETKRMVETLIEEKLTQVPIKIPSNIPTQTQFHEMHTRINDFRGSLLREIQNRDKSINLFAQQIAELTARLDAISPGVSREELEKARDKILNNWRVAKGPEKRSRIEMGLNKLINEVSPPPTPPEPKADSGGVEETDIKDKINPSKNKFKTQ